MVEMIDRESLRLNTRALIRQLREAASRVNNKSDEEVARSAAAHMEKLLMLYTDALEQADKQAEKIADMAERIQGWKSLVKSINERFRTMARRTADETADAKQNEEPSAGAKKKRRSYDYRGKLETFLTTGEESARITTVCADRTGKYAPGKRSMRYPSFYAMRNNARKMNAPVSVLWDEETCEIVLVRKREGGK